VVKVKLDPVLVAVIVLLSVSLAAPWSLATTVTAEPVSGMPKPETVDPSTTAVVSSE